MSALSTEIRIRPPVPADAPAIALGVRASFDELAPWLPWATDSYDQAGALAWMNGEFGDGIRFIIVDGEDAHLGSVALNQLDAENRCANLGYWTRTSAAGRGIATEGVRQIVRYAFAETDFERLEVVVCVENEASRRVAARAGAAYEGIAKARVRLHGRQHDAHIFSFTR